MKHVPTLLRRELSAYFLSPMAYLIFLAFQIIAAFDFNQLVVLLASNQRYHALSFGLDDPMIHYIAGSMVFWIGLMVALPALTMRLLAEEKRSGTIEGLLTLPITETEVVVSKWLAGVVMFWLLLAPFALYLPFLYHYGRYYFDLGPVISLSIGLTTLGMMFVSIGVFFSSLTRNQIIAAIATFMSMFFLILLVSLIQDIARERNSSWADPLRYLAVFYQVLSFASGRLDIRFPAIHLSVAAFMIWLSVKVLKTRQGT